MKLSWMIAFLFAGNALAQESKIYLIQSIIWQGQELNSLQTNALDKLIQDFPEDPKTYFVSSSYLSRPETDKNAQFFRSRIRNQDTLGLNMTAWKSEVESCGVKFRNSPTFFRSRLKVNGCQKDCGEEIPISVYTGSETRKLMKCYKQKIESLGRPARSLHVHGWMANRTILQSAFHLGFKADYSAVAPSIVRSKLYQYPIFPWIKMNWPAVSPLQQPYAIEFNKGHILQIGNFLASFDYLSDEQLVEYFRKTIHLAKSNKAPVVFHLSLRYESIDRHIKRYQRFRKIIESMSREAGLDVIPVAFQWREKDTSPKMKWKPRQGAETAK